MEELDIIKSGVVYLPVKNFLKTTWVDKFCVLHRATTKTPAFIEVFPNRKAFSEFKTRQKDCDIKRFELRQITSIKHLSESTSKGSEHKIEIQCRNQKQIILMFNDKHDSTDWYSMLNNVDGSQKSKVEPCSKDDSQEVNTVNEAYGTTEQAKRFTVDVEPSDFAKCFGIVGKMTMLILPTRCAFENFETKKTMYSFDLSCMHRLRAKKEQCTFEVSEKCPNGEGTITCNTPNANMIHKIIQDLMSNNLNAQVASNNSYVKEVQEIKKSTLSATEIDQHNVSSSWQVPPRNQEKSAIGISGPISVPIMVKKHPFASKTPVLIPIKHIEQDNETSVLSHPITKPTKDVIQTSKELDVKAKVENGAVRVANKKKEREKEEPSDKKKDKEDKKEKDRLLKEEKREREKLEKERKQKEKVEKKKSVPSKKTNQTKESMQSKDSQSYSEVSPEPSTYAQCGEIEDDAAETPAAATINKQTVDIYAAPVTCKRLNERNKNSSQGLQSKKDVTLTNQVDVYAEVSQIKTAWKDCAREDEHHEEDYSNFQKARHQMDESPPIPLQQHLEDSDDDDTYDTTSKFTGSKGKQMIKNKVANEHIYGVAGGKAVNVVPSHSHSGDSESALGELRVEAENTYDGYAVPDELTSSSLRVPHVPSYEDTDIHIQSQSSAKPEPPTTQALATETFYEEI